MAKLAFCDYHNMVAILEKTKHNTYFHQIVDFLEASHIRYALTIHPTVYVSHIRQFWSTARVKTTDGETKILAQVNGRRITRGTIRISQCKVPSPGVDKTTFSIGDVRYGEAFPTDTSLDAGSRLLRIMRRKKKDLLRRMLQTWGVDQGEDLLDRDKSADKGSDSTDEMSYVLGSLGAAYILASGGLRSVFTTASTDNSPTVATASESFPTTAIFTTASVATPTTRDKGKGKMTEPEQPSKEKVLLTNKIHAERELEMMIAKLDRSNEMVAKYLREYKQAEVGLSHDEKKVKDLRGQEFSWIKKLKTAKASSIEPTQEQQSKEPKELSEEELKKIMELVTVEELYIEAPQARLHLERFSTKFLNKNVHLPALQKKIEEINNFQQEFDESLFRPWERFKELLIKYPQHYLTDIQEVILFYNGLDVPTRQTLDSKGVIPFKTAADAKIAIQEMVEYSQKWNNGTSSRT
nr:hypothetical protein [Tanacetum cinerariifolium]